MTAATIRAINCTSCGAGLDILGGGRVQIQVCPYCGSALDAQEDFRVIAKYSDLERPETPLKLGDSGVIDDVDFTVIGIIGWVENYRGARWQWVDHQIFSPTHGYSWITYEDTGHLTITRKIRKHPKRWLSVVGVENAETRPTVWVGGKMYDYYETSTAQIDFLEGSFNWAPTLNQTATTITLILDDEMISLTQNTENTEREVERTRLLNDNELQSFGLAQPINAPSHPLAAPKRWQHFTFALTTCLAFLLLTLFLGYSFQASKGDVLVSADRVPLTSLPLELEFDVPKKANLVSVSLRTDVSNGWAYFDLELQSVEEDIVHLGGTEVSFYFYTGQDADGFWSEGSREDTFSFAPSAVGAHSLEIEMSEVGSGASGGSQTNTYLTAIIRARQYSWHPMAVVGLILSAMAGAIFGQEWLRKQAVFRKSDWSDD
ncbi:MAG: DUF4178 domain-containing protein [Roseobacter sp.]